MLLLQIGWCALSSATANFFEERYAEINAYLDFLQNLEVAAQTGAPRFQGSNARITTDQKKILNSSFYLQLYNLVEATVLRCLEGVVTAIETAQRLPSELSIGLRSEWVRSVARTHSELSPNKRLEAAIELCDQLLSQMPVQRFSIDAGGGGNWDDEAIYKICNRIGLDLKLSALVTSAAKSPVRDNMGALRLVKDRRNGLAHGSLSFVDCSDGVTVGELRKVALAVGEYLREAVALFEAFIKTEIKGASNVPQVQGVQV